MPAAEMVNEQSFEKHIGKQMGCMTGFLQIFDRHQILSGKRHYSAKRLQPSPVSFITSSFPLSIHHTLIISILISHYCFN